MRIFSLLILLVVASALQSQVVVNENVKHSKYTFPLVASKIKATVCYDANDYPVVKKVAELFVSDIENVTGQRLKLADEWKKGRTVVIVGTIEKNQAIRQLASNGKIRYLSSGRSMGTLFDSDRFPPISRSQQGAGDSGK